MISRKILYRILINTLLGGVLIFIWSRFVNLQQIWVTLSGVKFEYILILITVFLTSSILRSLRLKWLLGDDRLTFGSLINLTLLSQFLSFMIPIRAGEITKGVYLSGVLKRPFPTTIVWVFIDRFIDFYQVILLIVVSLVFIPTILPVNFVRGSVILLLGMTGLTVLMIKNQKFGLKLITFLSHLLIIDSIKIYFVSFFKSILEGFTILDLSVKRWTGVLGITLLAFIIDGVFWQIVFLSIGTDINLMTGVLGNALVALTFLIPAAPGYVGSAEAGGLAVWSGILGLSTSLASSGTVLFHLVTTLTLAVFGVISLYLLKFDLNLVWRRFKK